MRDSSTAPFLGFFPGMSKGQSGLIARKKACAFATAGLLTTAIAAKTWIAASILCAIGWLCAARRLVGLILGLD
jgi:hypothetical protein